MKNLSIVQLLRLAGMMAWLMYPLGMAVMLFNQPQMTPDSAMTAEDIAALVSLLLFGGCYWFNMRDIPLDQPTRRHFVLLALQILSAMGVWLFVGDAGLMYVVAAAIPLILQREQALKWMAAQLVLTLPLAWLMHENGGFNSVAEFRTLPAPLLIGVTALIVIAWQLFAFCVGWLAASETRNRRELARLNAELLAARYALAEKSRTDERLHISRELHDVMGHHLIALNLQLELARRCAPDEKETPIQVASAIARNLLAEVRKIVGFLRQENGGNLISFLRSLQSTLPSPSIHLDIAENWQGSTAVQHVFQRCIQEALSNTLRHANARNIWITLKQEAGKHALSIEDDGIGIGNTPAGNGLTGMRERIERLGGEMEIENRPAGGCRIEVGVQEKIEA